MSDLISRQDAIDAIVNTVSSIGFHDNSETARYGATYRQHEILDILNALPSAEAEDRLYIKIYADDDPSVMAEKLYQICDETQNGEVAEWLKEYFSSAEPKTGKWIIATGMMPPEFHGHHCCSECGNFANMEPPFGNREDLSNFCPYCGADMRGEQNDKR